jgi:hypothetical protein
VDQCVVGTAYLCSRLVPDVAMMPVVDEAGAAASAGVCMPAGRPAQEHHTIYIRAGSGVRKVLNSDANRWTDGVSLRAAACLFGQFGTTVISPSYMPSLLPLPH